MQGAQRQMAGNASEPLVITPHVLLKAYACGIFPMAESAEDQSLFWIEPEQRGILPLDGFHIPKRLAPHGPPGRVRDSHRP